MKMKVILVLGLAVSVFIANSAFAGDAAKGKQLFNRCAACHSDKAGVTRIGPSLYGVYGRVPGTLESFKNYSPAMKAFGAAGNKWDEKTLDVYLTNPRTAVPGNRMGFAGLPNHEEREHIIAFLKTLKAQ